MLSYCSILSVDISGGKVSPDMAFSWPFACMLCWTSIFSNDCQTYVYSWAWCDWTSRHCWVASKQFLQNLPTFLLAHAVNDV